MMMMMMMMMMIYMTARIILMESLESSSLTKVSFFEGFPLSLFFFIFLKKKTKPYHKESVSLSMTPTLFLR
jgi:hypothetical protein